MRQARTACLTRRRLSRPLGILSGLLLLCAVAVSVCSKPIPDNGWAGSAEITVSAGAS